MTRFYTVSDNSFDTRGFPWIDRIVKAYPPGPGCPECGWRSRTPLEDIECTLQPNKGVCWPDAIGNGAGGPSLVVSERVLGDWRSAGVTSVATGGRVFLQPPYPVRLRDTAPPAYAWVDGDSMLGARLDFDASGIVCKGPCTTCGRNRRDVVATHAHRNECGCPYVFVEDSWNGASLFTTDYSRAIFFCTDTILECARQHRHMNFRFIPVEAGSASWSKGINYLGKAWPVHHPLRRSEGRSIEEWLALLRGHSQRYEARCALLDMGKEAAPAVPVLLGLLNDSDNRLRREAKFLLDELKKRGLVLRPEDEAVARQYE